MINTKFILSDGQEVFPGYLDAEKRQQLREKLNAGICNMWCGCCSVSENLLPYKISADLKIYPEHNNYQHSLYCSRYKNPDGKTIRQTAYVVSEENGNITTYLSFNPKNFSQSQEVENEQDNADISEEMEKSGEEFIIPKKKTTKKEERKEPKLSLSGLVRGINTDTFTEKILSGKTIANKENFSRYVYHRMKKVYIAKTKKSIGELTLEKDGVRFIYVPFFSISKQNNHGLSQCYIQTSGQNGEIHNNLIFEETLNKVIDKFEKQYGILPDENTMLSGFQYVKKNRKGYSYKLLGRVHLFQVSEKGLYCKNMEEKELFNTIHRMCDENKNLMFHIPPEDETISGILSMKGCHRKILFLSQSNTNERIVYNATEYIPILITNDTRIAENDIYQYLNDKVT